MFGLSLTKIIFTIAVVVLVWNAFKYLTRLQDRREQRERVKQRDQSASQPEHQSKGGKAGIEEMVECQVCGAYVARGAKSCGRDGCPFVG